MTTHSERLDHTPVTFGKYKGMTPAAIANADPSYVVWMYEAWKKDGKPLPCSKLLRDECATCGPKDWDEFYAPSQYDVDPDLGDR